MHSKPIHPAIEGPLQSSRTSTEQLDTRRWFTRTTSLCWQTAAQMTESAPVVNPPLTKLLQKTVRPFKSISVVPDTIQLNGNCIRSMVLVERVTLLPRDRRPRDGADQDRSILGTENHWDEDDYYQEDDMPGTSYHTKASWYFIVRYGSQINRQQERKWLN